MRYIVGLTIAVMVMFQLFFRYDYWRSDHGGGLVYERDNLTGAIYEVKANEPVSLMVRILGRQSDIGVASKTPSTHKTAKTTQKDTKKASNKMEPTLIAQGPNGFQAANGYYPNTAYDVRPRLSPQQVQYRRPPQPRPQQRGYNHSYNMMMQSNNQGYTSAGVKRTANNSGIEHISRKIDLNGDGEMEHIIQTPDSAGFVDISIVSSSGKEVFFGRGTSLDILATRESGWVDIALNHRNSQQFFRWNGRTENYAKIPYSR